MLQSTYKGAARPVPRPTLFSTKADLGREKLKSFNGGKPIRFVDGKGQALPLIEILTKLRDA
jgi:hypothetical protein